MSRNCWESGTLKVPTKAWKALRDGVANGFNANQERRYKTALGLHAKLLDIKKKSPRGTFDCDKALRALAQDAAVTRDPAYADALHQAFYPVHKSLCERTESGKWKLKLPKKKDFPLAVATKTTSYAVGEASVSFDHAKREVTWDVPSNNHAVEDARAHPMGRLFFALLSKVEWTRGSGGTFAGNDEYNEESKECGSGANYVTATYGPRKPRAAAPSRSVNRYLTYRRN